MRRWVTGLVLLVVVFIAADQWARAAVQRVLEDTVADQLAARQANVEVAGLFVLPQLLAGELDQVELAVDDAVVGDPAVRLASIEGTLYGLEVPFPPPDVLDRVAVSDAEIEVLVLPRELQRLFAAQRPDWELTISSEGVRATTDFEGIEVSVLADVTVVNDALVFSATEVGAGALGVGVSNRIAGAFDTRLPLPDLPEGLVITEAVPGSEGLLLLGTIDGALVLR
jgi:hypothetical protein